MAQMIPHNIENTTVSQAERAFFLRLKNLPGSEEWIVIHSLAISESTENSQAEIDFLVLIPNLGVFVLEVKGSSLSFIDGKWYQSEYNHPIESPITQANRNLHNFIRYAESIETTDGYFSKIRMGYGLIFPDCSAKEQLATIPDLALDTICDADDLADADLLEYFTNLGRFWRTRTLANKSLSPPDQRKLNELRKALRPSVRLSLQLSSQIKGFEEETVYLTARQSFILDSLLENQRCLVRGAAGTGKTLLAMHFCEQMKRENKNFAFFCYNKRLAKYLQLKVDVPKGSVCDSFTEYMDKIVMQSPSAEEARILKGQDQNTYYKEKLPYIFIHIVEFMNLEKFDVLIIDEAQDLLTEEFLFALDVILKGGITKGVWYFFGDVDRQNIFSDDTVDFEVKYQFISNYAAKFRLKENCRNTSKIIEEIDDIFGDDTIYHREKEGVEVKRHVAKNIQAMQECLESELDYLFHENIKAEDITILSTHTLKNSVAKNITKYPIHEEIRPVPEKYNLVPSLASKEWRIKLSSCCWMS